MSYLINNQQKVNEIIFANRNKSYGAYAIRSAYGNTILKSLALMLSGFGTIMCVAFFMSNKPADESAAIQTLLDDSVYTVEVSLEPPKLPEPFIPQQKSQEGSSSMSTVISNTAAVETSTNMETGSGPTTSTLTTEGTGGPSSGTVASTPTVDSGVGEAVFAVPDSPPEFEGGLKALYAFLGSKLKFPNEALEIGKEGTVYVKFVVDQNGKVCNLKLLNNLGYGLDQEALRVVSMIPDFKSPGKVNGRAVKVYYQLPIKFKVK
ncbi:MAG: TonB family protein [Bacteroidetes bacterium]|nr:TonB family protein [Bacteroidota bacterium]